jgi:hypothetical protein
MDVIPLAQNKVWQWAVMNMIVNLWLLERHVIS